MATFRTRTGRYLFVWWHVGVLSWRLPWTWAGIRRKGAFSDAPGRAYGIWLGAINFNWE